MCCSYFWIVISCRQEAGGRSGERLVGKAGLEEMAGGKKKNGLRGRVMNVEGLLKAGGEKGWEAV